MAASGIGSDTPEGLEVNDTLKTVMNRAAIPGVAIAAVDSKDMISSVELGRTDKGEEVKSDSVFGAASLSKPVFAYLVLKLIEENKNGNAKGKVGELKYIPNDKDFLDRPLHELYPAILTKFHDKDLEKAKKLTARMVLSHTTGLPIVHGAGPIEFQFEPGTQYGYSGPGISYLQEVIEALTNSNLETLAKQYIFDPLEMNHSSFSQGTTSPQAANSLTTTASDYAKFLRAWMNDAALQYAFEPKGLSVDESKPVFSMKDAFLPNDWLIKDATVPNIDKEHVSWGLGFGLQLDDEGKPVSAYHSGDMSEWRAWVAINLKEKSAIVYFSNSHNGHLLAEEIIAPNVKLDHVFNFFFKTYGFARNLDELAKDKGIEFNNGLRQGCLSKNSIEEKKPSIEIEKMLEYENNRFPEKFNKFINAIGDEGFKYLMTNSPIASSEMQFIQEHKDDFDAATAFVIKRRQNITAILLSDKGVEAFEQKLINLHEAMNMKHPHHLQALLSDNGLIGLKEGLITPKDALRFGENSSQYLEVLCSDLGLSRLREAKASDDGNLEKMLTMIADHAKTFNNVGVLEYSITTGKPIDQVQADIEKQEFRRNT